MDTTISEQIISPYDTTDLVHANEKSLAQVFGSSMLIFLS